MILLIKYVHYEVMISGFGTSTRHWWTPLCPQKQYDQLITEQKDLAAARDDVQEITRKCNQRSLKLSQDLERDQESNRQDIENEKVWLCGSGDLDPVT